VFAPLGVRQGDAPQRTRLRQRDRRMARDRTACGSLMPGASNGRSTGDASASPSCRMSVSVSILARTGREVDDRAGATVSLRREAVAVRDGRDWDAWPARLSSGERRSLAGHGRRSGVSRDERLVEHRRPRVFVPMDEAGEKLQTGRIDNDPVAGRPRSRPSSTPGRRTHLPAPAHGPSPGPAHGAHRRGPPPRPHAPHPSESSPASPFLPSTRRRHRNVRSTSWPAITAPALVNVSSFTAKCCVRAWMSRRRRWRGLLE
jgi:hypothetical protein